VRAFYEQAHTSSRNLHKRQLNENSPRVVDGALSQRELDPALNWLEPTLFRARSPIHRTHMSPHARDSGLKLLRGSGTRPLEEEADPSHRSLFIKR